MMKSLAASAVAAMAISTLAAPAQADDPDNGFDYGRWSKSEVTVHAVTPMRGSGWKLRKAINAWNSAGVITIKRTSKLEGADITITELPASAREAEVAGWLGLAYVLWTDTDGEIASCGIELNEDVEKSYRKRVMAHELGHCLGLNHGDQEGSIMHDHDTLEVSDLDKAALATRYAQ